MSVTKEADSGVGDNNCRVTICQAQNFSQVLPCGQYSGQLWAVDMKRGLAC